MGQDRLDQFAACWEDLEDLRTGNAGLHDFHELLMIALRTVLSGGQGAVDHGGVRQGEKAVPAPLVRSRQRQVAAASTPP